MAELVVLVGLPASGKSSFYRARFAGTHALVSKDLLRNNRSPARRQEELIRAALSAGRSVVVDNTNTRSDDRRALVALARGFGASTVAYHFTAEAADCLQRNAGREGRARVPPVAIFAAKKQLTPPAPDEGFDARYTVALEGGDRFRVEPAA